MANKRKNFRGRNNRKGKMNIYTLSISLLIILIVVCSIILIIKRIDKKMKEVSIDSNAELYMLFKEIDLETKKLTSSSSNKVYENTEDTVINIVAVGEILCEKAIYEDAYNSATGEYNFSHMFKDVSKYIQDADVAIGLLETNFVSSENISGQNLYNSPIQLAQELKDIGIDILNTANNHSLDYGYQGITSTIDVLDEVGISHVGTYKTEEDYTKILIKEIKGIKLAFLSYTYGTNISSDVIPESKYCVSLIDKDRIKNDIVKAREEGADYVFVNMHWGDLTSSKQTQEQKELADYLFENGVDYILGSHPASLEPMEIRENSSGQNVFIAYSTGNFISASKYTNSDIEMILNIEITKVAATGETYLTKVTYTPVYLLDNGISAINRFQLLDAKTEIEQYESGNTKISVDTYNKLKNTVEKIETLIGK